MLLVVLVGNNSRQYNQEHKEIPVRTKRAIVFPYRLLCHRNCGYYK